MTTTTRTVTKIDNKPSLYYDGDMIGIEIKDKGRIARLHLNPDGKQYLAEHSEIQTDDDAEHIVFTRDRQTILWDLFESLIVNGKVALLSNMTSDYSRIGALTDSPIFAFDVERDDDLNISEIGDTYWFPDYMIRDELAELMIEGFVDFTRSD